MVKLWLRFLIVKWNFYHLLFKAAKIYDKHNKSITTMEHWLLKSDKKYYEKLRLEPDNYSVATGLPDLLIHSQNTFEMKLYYQIEKFIIHSEYLNKTGYWMLSKPLKDYFSEVSRLTQLYIQHLKGEYL